jgi:[protein-PII] uridylyltransferase
MLFSQTAVSRDIDDPKTIADFVAVVQTPERLRLLLLITVADMLAVGPTIWNPWRNALLRELYARSEKALGTPLRQLEQELLGAAQETCHRLLEAAAPAIRQQFDERVTPQWLLGMPEDGMAPALKLLARHWQSQEATISFDYEIHQFAAHTRLYFCLSDIAHLLEYLCGVMVLSRANITGCRSYTLKDGTVCMLMEIQDAAGAAFTDEKALKDMVPLLQRIINHEVWLDDVLEHWKRPKSGPRRGTPPPQIHLDNHVSEQCSVLEIQAGDRPGLLYDIAQVVSQNGLNIITTHISTWGDRAVDVLYVKDRFGLKLEHAAKTDKLRVELLNRLMKDR